jgi:hypothetical protein
MGTAASVAIDEGTRQDLQWFFACAHAANGTVTIYKCLQPQTDIFVDASLSGLGGVLNVFVALQVFADFVRGRQVMV